MSIRVSNIAQTRNESVIVWVNGWIMCRVDWKGTVTVMVVVVCGNGCGVGCAGVVGEWWNALLTVIIGF